MPPKSKTRKKAQGRANLRALYKKDPKASAFLQAHPEFGGFEAEQYDGLTEYVPPLNEAREAEFEQISAHLHRYPDRIVKQMLKAYYEEHRSIKEIADMLGVSKKAASSEIMRAKRAVLAFINGSSVNLSTVHKLGERKLKHRGMERTILLVVHGGLPTWVSSDGLVLPDELQAFLKGELK